jgi:hypothetical protein
MLTPSRGLQDGHDMTKGISKLLLPLWQLALLNSMVTI